MPRPTEDARVRLHSTNSLICSLCLWSSSEASAALSTFRNRLVEERSMRQTSCIRSSSGNLLA
eukprot:CAMPEP_0173311300 /NCGR_PEP_ID=MMETSP1143-20121109/23439_1 /TAXON_ID=483371 /ORGANISM="non described non described, Strain CCMP2298" /LENGTH=62 /DNA_ID=CAMNT_0014253247 /DNA_START=104 /DNA_END=289 /DNA_ORIENTATION=+